MASKTAPKRIIYIPFDQLHTDYGALQQANKKEDLILFVESKRMVDPKKYHPERLFFLLSSARHFSQQLIDSGFNVSYLQAPTTLDGIRAASQKYGNTPLFAARQSSYRLQRALEAIGTTFFENNFFLTPQKLFDEWAGGQKNFLMENFYRKQRTRLNILMQDGKPLGGQWNFDKDNREPLPRNYEWQNYLSFQRDAIDIEVAGSLGIEAKGTWATTRTQALMQLDNFLENHFENFGRYEDAMSSENWAVHHSLLSPYLNNGLLHASEVVAAAVQKFEGGTIPIAAAEALIRQIIGWREYINGMYWHLGEEYRKSNGLRATRKLLPLYTDPTKTEMNCLKSIVTDIQERSWVHHIPRLMVLSNMALLAGVDPQQFLEWMRNSFIDASDWVMVPNIIGMGVHADGGQMMTKPYASGGAYISRMSNYCKGCIYDPKKRVGEDACPFTTLYWNFLAEHEATFSQNHRMAQQLGGLRRLSDLGQISERAKQVLAGMDKGKI
jgi:deoxyribodipyrimidine photolyase-related protein